MRRRRASVSHLALALLSLRFHSTCDIETYSQDDRGPEKASRNPNELY